MQSSKKRPKHVEQFCSCQ